MSKVKAWLRSAWSWIAGVLVLIAGAFGLWQFARYRRRELGKVRDALAFERATAEIKVLQAVRAQVEADVGRTDSQIERIGAEIARSKRDVIEAFDNGKGLSDEEVLREFARLGI